MCLNPGGFSSDTALADAFLFSLLPGDTSGDASPPTAWLDLFSYFVILMTKSLRFSVGICLRPLTRAILSLTVVFGELFSIIFFTNSYIFTICYARSPRERAGL